MRAYISWGVCVLLFAFAGLLTAQTYEGRILGTVTDQSGASVRDARITITNVDTGVTRTVASNEAGDYVASNLAPGVYRIVVELTGFKKVQRDGVRLEVGKDLRIDLTLAPGATTETVTVTSEIPQIETTNDSIGGSFSNKSINELPLNGRDYQNLVVLRPGIQRTPGGGFESITSNGLRPEDNNFIVDGVDDNDPYYSGNIINGEGVQGTPGSILPIDAIQEFNTEENPSAEYGYKPGATINIGLKSGTNTPHGTAYYFGRNNALDARNFFNVVGTPQNALRQHQFGASFGGPIVHDKLFIFGDYEGVRAQVSNSDQVQTPETVSVPSGAGAGCQILTTGDCNNSLVDALADLKASGTAVSPTTANLIGLGSFTGNGPFPGLLLKNDGTNGTSVQSGFPNVNRSDSFIIKSDYHRSDHNTFSGRYLFGDSFQIEQNFIVPRAQWRSTSKLRAQVAGGSWTWTPGNRWVNEARFGYNRFWQAILPADQNADPLKVYGINTGVTNPVNFGLPEIDYGNFTSLGNISGWPLETTPNQTYQVGDNVSYTRGKHTFRFGGEFRRGSTDNIRNRHAQGRFQFASLEDFLTGTLSKASLFVGDSERYVTIKSIAGFGQDDWRVTPRFTINAGLRYDFSGVINESKNLLGNFDPSVGLEQVGINISKPYNNNPHNFAPRIGLAWDPRGDSKTVLRAGVSMIYEIPHISVFIGQNGVDNATTTGLGTIPTGANGSNIKGTIVSAAQTIPIADWNTTPIFASTSVPDCNPSDPNGAPCNILGVDKNLKTPYVISWNLNIQRALTNATSVQVAYVGNHGVHLYSVTDINQVDPNSPAEIACGHCEQAGRPFNAAYPFLGVINFLGNRYSSNYNGLQISGTQRVWHGLNFVLGYTYAHAIDDVTNNRGLNPQNSLRPDSERASGDDDIRHRFTLALTYDLPGRKGWAHLLEGWQTNTILTLQTGAPWSLVDGYVNGNDISLTGEFADRWNIIGPPSAIKVSPAGIPFFAFSQDPVTGVISGNPDCLAHADPNQLLAFGCYEQNGTILVPPNAGTFGNLGRNAFRARPIRLWDFSLSKTTTLTERLKLQFRAEFFNVLNHPTFGNPVTLLTNDPSVQGNLGVLSATADVAAANPVIGTGGPRNIQLGLKFIF
jgi:carboxypeptidase family protein/TonB-dependent receptor-like protein